MSNEEEEGEAAARSFVRSFFSQSFRDRGEEEGSSALHYIALHYIALHYTTFRGEKPSVV